MSAAVDWGLSDCGGAEGRIERQVGLDTPLSPQEEEVGVLCDGEGGAQFIDIVLTPALLLLRYRLLSLILITAAPDIRLLLTSSRVLLLPKSFVFKCVYKVLHYILLLWKNPRMLFPESLTCRPPSVPPIVLYPLWALYQPPLNNQFKIFIKITIVGFFKF